VAQRLGKIALASDAKSYDELGRALRKVMASSHVAYERTVESRHVPEVKTAQALQHTETALVTT